MVLARRNATAILAASILGVAAGAVHGAGEPIALWNANASGIVSYKMYEAKAKVGDFVYVDAHQVHPTQICLGYREMLFKAGDLSTYNTDKASRDPKAGIYPYLAKKDVPIIISPDGAPYITDGHHTLAALLASTQADKTAFGHVVATFYGKSEADFVAFMADPKNNDCYLFGPEGNGLLNTPGPLAFNKLPPTVYSENPAGRMANDFYRSLGWGIKEAGYTSNEDGNKSREATILFANFIEFRWADLYRGKIMWNDKSDEAFYIAVVNANTLAHSESTKDISGSIAARDLPGYLPAKAGDAGPLNITNDAYIVGDICPSALSNNVLTVNAKADTTLVVGGKLSHLGHVQINGGGLASSTVDKGALTTHVVIPAGSGMVVFAGDSDYSGVTTVKAGKLLINGAIPDSPVEVEKGAVVGGSGHVGAISGAGLVSPGNSAGILRAASVDPVVALRAE